MVNMDMKLRNQIAARLRQAMDTHPRLNRQDPLSKASGVGQTTIGRILRAEVDARSETLNRIADSLGVDVNYFWGSSFDNVSKGPDRKEVRRAPVISWIQAGAWNEAQDLYHPGDGEDWEEVPPTASDSAFWLRVIGDSMTAPTGTSIPEGSLILVDPEINPASGRLVVAKLTDTDEVTFKRLVSDGGRHYLKPLNPAYPAIPIDCECNIVGVVTESKQKH